MRLSSGGRSLAFAAPIATTLIIAIAIPLVWLVASRELSVGTDTLNYYFFYQRAVDCQCIPEGIEPAFGFLAWVGSHFGETQLAFFGLISLIQIASLCVVADRMAQLLLRDEERGIFVLAFLSVLLVFPFFASIQLNILRQGLSAPFVILAALSFSERRWLSSGILAMVAVGFHYSAAMYLLCVSFLLLSHRKIFFISSVLTVAYAVGAAEGLVRTVSDGLGIPLYAFVADYGASVDYKAGTRLDFLLFSMLPALTYLLATVIRVSNEFREKLIFLGKIYAVLLFPFLLFGWAAFADRYALIAWLVMPGFAALVLVRVVPKYLSWMHGILVFVALLVFYSIGF